MTPDEAMARRLALRDPNQQTDREANRDWRVPVETPPSAARWFEVRAYRTGWVARIGRVLLRWQRDANATSLTVERIGRGYQLVGGRILAGGHRA